MKYLGLLLVTFCLTILTNESIANGDIPAYYKVTSLEVGMDEAIQTVISALADNGFEVLGDYSPSANEKFHVIAFTSMNLQRICKEVEDRGVLASILKVGLISVDGKIDISIVNPEYLFYGYLRENAELHKNDLDMVTANVKEALGTLGNDWVPFGGAQTPKDLKKYHYMIGMPYFDNPVKLNEFSSFGLGVETIRKNLEEGKGSTIKVYEVIMRSEEIAVFGIGLLDPEDGEGRFLPIIGDSHIAAMPYEIILQGNKATMLHGRFRFALHWPELTMGTFTKIMSTPGYVKKTMKEITE